MAKDFAKIKIRTTKADGSVEEQEDVPPGKKARLEDTMSYNNIKALIEQKKKEKQAAGQ
jgi:hypothetical protein